MRNRATDGRSKIQKLITTPIGISAQWRRTVTHSRLLWPDIFQWRFILNINSLYVTTQNGKQSCNGHCTTTKWQSSVSLWLFPRFHDHCRWNGERHYQAHVQATRYTRYTLYTPYTLHRMSHNVEWYTLSVSLYICMCSPSCMHSVVQCRPIIEQ